jgi:hypothetical protein
MSPTAWGWTAIITAAAAIFVATLTMKPSPR